MQKLYDFVKKKKVNENIWLQSSANFLHLTEGLRIFMTKLSYFQDKSKVLWLLYVSYLVYFDQYISSSWYSLQHFLMAFKSLWFISVLMVIQQYSFQKIIITLLWCYWEEKWFPRHLERKYWTFSHAWAWPSHINKLIRWTKGRRSKP